MLRKVNLLLSRENLHCLLPVLGKGISRLIIDQDKIQYTIKVIVEINR